MPPPMGSSLAFGQPRRLQGLGTSIALFVCTALFLFCSCDRHQPGEMPEVQRNKLEEAKSAPAEKAETTATSPSPTAKPTPAEFFPTKPQ